jgi:hypothetical protein
MDVLTTDRANREPALDCGASPRAAGFLVSCSPGHIENSPVTFATSQAGRRQQEQQRKTKE